MSEADDVVAALKRAAQMEAALKKVVERFGRGGYAWSPGDKRVLAEAREALESKP